MSSAIAKEVECPQSVGPRPKAKVVDLPTRRAPPSPAKAGIGVGVGIGKWREASVCDGLCSSLQSLNGCTENRE